ncbi:hypothetical protein C5Y96_05700 [Blastopirellula marina]|uniref:Phage head-tail joining protein domain-containing protein n=1 Tax=Blastopirellula marina TaxID=124 RepID=A0A2S8G4H7_9BACT|nr:MULTISPECIES: hypothetical protein [Pirellulaceae]PQO39348.1 hypothetical protein C5Y96_05700 [Blastopirellula marina]RCS55656.1 hypothetical protein DTL36_05710 [Bremerella cremea]
MQNLLANMARQAVRLAIAATSTTVTISRGGTTSDPIKVGRGRSVTQFVSAGDAFTDDEAREDFIVWPADYDLGSGPVEPAEGDRITIDDGVNTVVYEVTPLPPERGYRYTDRFRTAWRIHTLIVDEQASE